MKDGAALAVAVAVAAAAFAAPPVHPAVSLLFVALWSVRRRPELLAIALVVLVGGRAHQSLDALAAPLPTGVHGIAQLASDPDPARFGTRVVLRAEGRRYLAEVPFDRSAPLRTLLAGEHVQVRGRPSPLRSAPSGWVRSQHLAGRLSVSELQAVDEAAPWHRAVNGLHRTLRAGAESFGALRPLYLGLVIGDDRGQSELTRHRFEAAGLTHLLAVSGSNVAFVLAVVAPLASRLQPRGRVVLGVVVLTGFTLLTRAEPSVLRASVMAGLALLAVTSGRVAPVSRVLALAVTALLVADPLLVHSLGFQLSVAATAGLVLGTRPLAERLPGPDWLRVPVAVTVAAQLATAPLLLALNGAIPSVATLANLLAGPAAGAVMVLGATAGILAGVLGERSAALVQLPARWLVQWIDGVATWSSQLPAPMLGPLHLLGGAGVALAWWWHRRRRRVGGPGRVVLLGGAACSVVAALLAGPGAAGPGVHRPAAGVVVHVGGCGGVVVELSGASGERAVLRGLATLGLRRVDVLAVGDARSDVRTAATVAEQVHVALALTTADPAPDGLVPLGGRSLSVGGLTVTAGDRNNGASVLSVARDPRCSVAP